MKNKLTYVALFSFWVVLLSSCASTYKSVKPQTLNYPAQETHNGIEVAYRYDVMADMGNKKYAKKEKKKGIRVIAVRVTNNSDKTITLGQDMAFFSGQNQIFPLEPAVTKNLLKQSVAPYLLFLLLTPMQLNINNNGSQSSYPIGLALGPGIAGGNMAVAATANSNFEKELLEYNTMNKSIRSGETTYGILVFRDMGYAPISIREIRKQ